MTNDKEAGRILAGAADLLARPGAWIQGIRRRPGKGGTMSYCAIGAIEEASGWHRGGNVDLDTISHASEVLAESLGLPTVMPMTAVAQWNDGVARTQAEVVTALRKAAAECLHRTTQ